MSSNVIIRNDTRNCGLIADLDSVDEYGEWTVRNDCGRSVFVLRQSGTVQHIASTNYTGIRGKYGVTITEMVRSVSDVDSRGCRKSLNNLSNRRMTIYTVLETELEKGPVFIPQLGIAIGYQNDQQLRDAHPYACGSLQEDLERNTQKRINGITSVLCSINTYDKTVRTVYTIVNGGVVLCGVSHDVAKPEGVVLRTTIGESHANEDTNLYTVTSVDGKENELNAHTLLDLEISDKDGNIWNFSTDRKVLAEKIQKKKLREAGKFDSSEVDEQVKQRTKELEHDKQELKENVELLTQRVALLTSKKQNLEDELNGRNTATRQTHEEYMSEMKLSMAKREQEMEQVRFDKERMSLEMIARENQRKAQEAESQRAYDEKIRAQQLELERIKSEAGKAKAEADKEIAESKVELAKMSEKAAMQSREVEALKAEVEKTKAAADEEVAKTKVEVAKLSKESAEKSSIADTVKAAAIIIPAVIAIGAGVYAFMNSKGAATAALGCAASSATPAAMVLTAAAVAPVVAKPAMVLVTKAVKTVAKGAKMVIPAARKTFKAIGSHLASGTKKVFTVAAKCVTGVCTGVKRAAKAAISCGSRVVKAVAKGAKKVFNRGKEVVAGAVRTAASVASTIYNKGKQVVSSVYNGVKTCVSKAADVASSCVHTVCDAASSIYSGAKSVISNVCDTIFSWF